MHDCAHVVDIFDFDTSEEGSLIRQARQKREHKDQQAEAIAEARAEFHRDSGQYVPQSFIDTVTMLSQWFDLTHSQCWAMIKRDHPEEYATLTKEYVIDAELKAARKALADAIFEDKYAEAVRLSRFKTAD